MAKTATLTFSTSRRSGVGKRSHKKRKSSGKRRSSAGRSRNSVKALPRRSYKRGSFKRYCAAKGFKGANGACIEHALKHGTTKRKRQAVLVRTLNRIRPK
jgi:hypothetical protein